MISFSNVKKNTQYQVFCRKERKFYKNPQNWEKSYFLAIFIGKGQIFDSDNNFFLTAIECGIFRKTENTPY